MSVLYSTDLPNEMAWGTKKKMFYDTDYVATSKRLLYPAIFLRESILLMSVWLICGCAIFNVFRQKEKHTKSWKQRKKKRKKRLKIFKNV